MGENEKENNKSFPEFMGSHPSAENRSKKFLEWEDEIRFKFPAIGINKCLQ